MNKYIFFYKRQKIWTAQDWLGSTRKETFSSSGRLNKADLQTDDRYK